MYIADRIKSLLIRLRGKFKTSNDVKSNNIDSRKHFAKTVNVNSATENDLEIMGRKVGPNVTLSHEVVKPYLVTMNDRKCFEYEKDMETSEPSESILTMQVLKNKKTGRVVVYPGDLKMIRKMFNDDWVIVESEIK